MSSRLLLVGIFAFAWKKRQTISLSFLIFDFKDEFGDIQEMYIQSDKDTGFQDFTNIKYNLQRFWKDASESSNYDAEVKRITEKHTEEVKEQNNKSALGCLFIFIIFVVIWILNN